MVGSQRNEEIKTKLLRTPQVWVIKLKNPILSSWDIARLHYKGSASYKGDSRLCRRHRAQSAFVCKTSMRQQTGLWALMLIQHMQSSLFYIVCKSNIQCSSHGLCSPQHIFLFKEQQQPSTFVKCNNVILLTACSELYHS